MWSDWLADILKRTTAEGGETRVPVYVEIDGKRAPAVAIETMTIDGRKVIVIQDRIE